VVEYFCLSLTKHLRNRLNTGEPENTYIRKAVLQPEVRGYQFFESVSDPYPQRTMRIRTFLQIDVHIRYDSFSCIQSTGMIEQTECETTPTGGQVATGLLYCNACRLELRDSDAVFIT